MMAYSMGALTSNGMETSACYTLHTTKLNGKLVAKLISLAPYLKVGIRWLTAAANQDVNQRSVVARLCHAQEHANTEALQTAAAKMMLVVSLLKTKDSKWYSRVKWFSTLK